MLQLSAAELELNYMKEAEKLKEMMPDEESQIQNGKNVGIVSLDVARTICLKGNY